MAGEYTLSDEEEKYIRGIAGAQSGGSGFNTTRMTASNFNNIYQNEKQKLIERRLSSSGTTSASAKDSGGTASGSISSSFSGIADQDTRDMLKDLLNQFNTGGTAEYQKAQAAKEASISGIDAALADYSKQGAFTDASQLMQKNLMDSMEANKPAIQKAMEGAGTSAGSMQALLSQQLSDKTALSAGALGAEQAKAYGQISASLLGTRGGLTTGEDQSIKPMTAIADLLKTSSSQSQAYGNFDPSAQLQNIAQATNIWDTISKRNKLTSDSQGGGINATDYGLGNHSQVFGSQTY